MKRSPAAPIRRGTDWGSALMGAVTMLFMLSFAAAALALGSAAAGLAAGDRMTVQIMAGEPERRAREAQAALAFLEQHRAVMQARQVGEAEMERLLGPWLGEGSLSVDIPIPALIDVDLESPATGSDIERQLKRLAPSAVVDDHGSWLGPVRRLLASLAWLAGLMALLTAAASAGTVILASRGALSRHQETIEILHLMGATDRQIARHFERAVARDALIGATLGALAAALLFWLLGERIQGLGSDLVGSASLSKRNWAVLALIPIAGVLLAMLVARGTILRALNRLP
ncbi:MAG TPA: FtsX-like permease family protein [Allosphingosinicella sp.]|nr:FtsX-like permease family protein [Allosphingosinicella sp.]